MWLQQQLFVVFDHLRKLKRKGIPSKLVDVLTREEVENLQIYIDVIPELKVSTPSPATPKKRQLGRWDSGVSAASIGSNSSIPAAQGRRWDSSASSCSSADEASSTPSASVQTSQNKDC